MGSLLSTDVLNRAYFTGIATSRDLDTRLVDPSLRRRASEVMDGVRKDTTLPAVELCQWHSPICQRPATGGVPDSYTEVLQLYQRDAYNLLLWWFGVDADERVPRRAGGNVQQARRRLLYECMEEMRERHTAHHWIQRALQPIELRPQRMTTLTSPSLWPCALNVQDAGMAAILTPLVDYRDLVMIKMQPITAESLLVLQETTTTDQDHPLVAFTFDVLYGRLLRELTTRWPRVVTTHFATCLDAFVGPSMVATVDPTGAASFLFRPGSDLVLYQVTVAGDMMITRALEEAIGEIKALHEGNDSLVHARVADRLAAWTWQVFFSVAAAADLLDVNHEDLHPGNVLLSTAEGRPYCDRVLAYRCRGAETLANLVYLTAEDHGNAMVEIIDFGRSRPRTTAEERDQRARIMERKVDKQTKTADARHTAAARLIDDMLLFLTYKDALAHVLTKGLGTKQSEAHTLLAETVTKLTTAKMHGDDVVAIFESWPLLPMFQHLRSRDFAPYIMTVPGTNVRPWFKPLLVGYMPDAIDVARMAEERSPHSLSCLACGGQRSVTYAAVHDDHTAFYCDHALCKAVANGDMDMLTANML